MGNKRLKTYQMVVLPVEFRGIICQEKFNIIEDEAEEELTLSYLACQRLKRKSSVNITNKAEAEKLNRPLGLVCRIETGNAQPISWTRPIKSYQDRKEFFALI